MPIAGEYRDLQKAVADWVESVTASAPRIKSDPNAIADLKSLLDSFNSKDFSSETTLEAMRVLLNSLDGKNFTTETTLVALKALFENGTAQVQLPSSSSLNHGSQDVIISGTSIQMPSQTCKEATIIAKDANSGFIYLGGATVSSGNYGAKLAAKDSITLKINNTNLVYINADNSGEGVTYIAI